MNNFTNHVFRSKTAHSIIHEPKPSITDTGDGTCDTIFKPEGTGDVIPVGPNHQDVDGSRAARAYWDEDMRRLYQSLEAKNDSAESCYLRCLDLPSTPRHVTLSDLDVLKLLGKGATGRVFLVRVKVTGEVYALKVMSKTNHDGLVKSNSELDAIVSEASLLRSTSDLTGVVNVEAAWHDAQNFYILMPYLAGGDLAEQMFATRKLAQNRVKFYAAEIALALNQLHNHDIIHRDIKPANVLLTENGHALLGDLGSAARRQEAHALTLTGSVSYLSPEACAGHPQGCAGDWWSLGVTIYHLLTGRLPFGHNEVDHAKIMDHIVSSPLTFHDSDNLDPIAIDLLSRLLMKDPSTRATHDTIKNHKFFRGVNWKNVHRTEAPFRPLIRPIPRDAKVTPPFNYGPDVTLRNDYFPSFSYLSPSAKELLQRIDTQSPAIPNLSLFGRVRGFFKRNPDPSTPYNTLMHNSSSSTVLKHGLSNFPRYGSTLHNNSGSSTAVGYDDTPMHDTSDSTTSTGYNTTTDNTNNNPESTTAASCDISMHDTSNTTTSTRFNTITYNNSDSTTPACYVNTLHNDSGTMVSARSDTAKLPITSPSLGNTLSDSPPIPVKGSPVSLNAHKYPICTPEPQSNISAFQRVIRWVKSALGFGVQNVGIGGGRKLRPFSLRVDVPLPL